jgi:predicted PolB exonuclease-like 3'-5' exonuclease
MGYIPPDETGSDLLFFDIETAPMIGAAEYIEPGEAPANYKDQDKIAAYIAAAQVKELEKAALDLDLCRVVAIGWAANDGGVQSAVNVPERDMLEAFWAMTREPGRAVVGFNCLGFDLPVLVRRSQYLGVSVPYLNLGKYKHTGILDVMQMLAFDGLVRARSQAFYCKRFNITGGPVADAVTGADIGRLVEAGEWDKVEAHVIADVEKTRALYRRVTGGGA